jgi:hypothetical protein
VTCSRSPADTVGRSPIGTEAQAASVAAAAMVMKRFIVASA